MPSQHDSHKHSKGKRPTQREVPLEPGHVAQLGELRIRSVQIGALPLINHFLDRMKLGEFLAQYLPPDDVRLRMPSHRVLLVLLRNVLMSREPIYAIPEWAAQYAPELLDLFADQLEQLSDDRIGRALWQVFETPPDMYLAIVRHVIQEFQVGLDELHNDSTTISFHGAYRKAAEENTFRGVHVPAITWGFSKDGRPDLKQLLYTLTITNDGNIPIYFTSDSGNVTDDTTHIATWTLLCQLVGSVDFLYVADCKVASEKNLVHIASRGGRFVTIMPHSHGEDKAFRSRLEKNPKSIRWVHVLTRGDEDDVDGDRVSVCEEEHRTDDGFRLYWFQSTRKARHDEQTRVERLARALGELQALQDRLTTPRTRLRDATKVRAAVDELLEARCVGSFLNVEVQTEETETFRQVGRGRPTENTKYRRDVQSRCRLSWEVDVAALQTARATDGIFPLITNDVKMTAEGVYSAYKRQPHIEKRFSQFKTDFSVAPVYLKNVRRIIGLLGIYFLALMIQALFERELRRKLAASTEPSLPLYAEERRCKFPTTRRVLDVMEPIARHDIRLPDGSESTVVTTLTPVQRRLIKLLGLSPDTYGY